MVVVVGLREFLVGSWCGKGGSWMGEEGAFVGKGGVGGVLVGLSGVKSGSWYSQWSSGHVSFVTNHCH